MNTALVLPVAAAILSYVQLSLTDQENVENVVLRKKQDGSDLLDCKKLLDVIHVLAKTNSRLINAAMNGANDENTPDKEPNTEWAQKVEEEIKENFEASSKVVNIHKLVKFSV